MWGCWHTPSKCSSVGTVSRAADAVRTRHGDTVQVIIKRTVKLWEGLFAVSRRYTNESCSRTKPQPSPYGRRFRCARLPFSDIIHASVNCSFQTLGAADVMTTTYSRPARFISADRLVARVVVCRHQHRTSMQRSMRVYTQRDA